MGSTLTDRWFQTNPGLRKIWTGLVCHVENQDMVLKPYNDRRDCGKAQPQVAIRRWSPCKTWWSLPMANSFGIRKANSTCYCRQGRRSRKPTTSVVGSSRTGNAWGDGPTMALAALVVHGPLSQASTKRVDRSVNGDYWLCSTLFSYSLSSIK